jgi:hypothetical protein
VGGYAMVLALIAAKAVKDRYGSKLGAFAGGFARKSRGTSTAPSHANAGQPV